MAVGGSNHGIDIIAIFSTRKWIVPAIPEIVFEAGFVLTKRELLLGLFALLMVIASISMIRTKKKIASKSKHFSPPLIIIEGLLIDWRFARKGVHERPVRHLQLLARCKHVRVLS